MMTRNLVLDNYYLDCRCMLLELAATLDRYDRAPVPLEDTQLADERLLRLAQAIEVLGRPSANPDRAERILKLLSYPVVANP